MNSDQNIQKDNAREIEKLKEALGKLDRAKEDLDKIAKDLLKIQHKFESYLLSTSKKTFM